MTADGGRTPPPIDRSAPESPRALITGATGYIGGRLVPVLLEHGARVRASGRSLDRLRAQPWSARAELVEADLADRMAVRRALAGVDVVVFLVHAMTGGSGFEEREARMARIMTEEAARAGVRRIVYLSGLHPQGEQLSAHMSSRSRVGEILRGGEVPVLILEAGTVIGAGSASFEIIRHLSERLPLMPAPRWVHHRIEPVAITDVLHHLSQAVLSREDVAGAVGVGSGETTLRFADLLTIYAEVAGLGRRRVLALPVPAPRLSGLWISLITPVPASLARPLAESMQHDAVTRPPLAQDVLPPLPHGPTPYREAVRAALEAQRTGDLASSWDDDSSLAASPEAPLPADPDWAGHTVFTDVRELEAADVSPEAAWRVIEGIGGASGWYSTPLLWTLRGMVDRVVGGPGLRRGRRDPRALRVGDAVDWWRVERIDRGEGSRTLLLRAEMRMSGRAWLELSVSPREGGGVRYSQRAVYFPDGLAGRLYWFGIAPFHALVFPAMARNVLEAARRGEDVAPSS
ncbi:SDR family oxidoreductase [Brachybacterium hainanense]|uniref:SDR family oxidoreductase n=1 Tax=Brachybacterium hainanense TaxID=1541174 RepID=A0ABV6RBM1_9MICO